MTQVLLRLMAPILSFTAEEAWAVLHPAKRQSARDSIFFHTWNDVLPAQHGEAELVARWKRIREIRAEVMKKLEEVRAAGGIGSSLQANVTVTAGGEDAALLASLGNDLKYVFITSSAALEAMARPARSTSWCRRAATPSASVAGIGAPTWAATRDTRRSARVAPATLEGRDEERRHA